MSPKGKDFRDSLIYTDELTLSERTERLAKIYSTFGEAKDMLFLGGPVAFHAIEEIFRSYIEGNFLSVVLLTHVFAENTLGSSLIMSSHPKEITERGFKKIIDQCLEDGEINSDDHAQLDELRKMRVAYTHPHEGIPKRSHMNRILDSGLPPEDLLLKDANQCLEILADVFGLRDNTVSQ